MAIVRTVLHLASDEVFACLTCSRSLSLCNLGKFCQRFNRFYSAACYAQAMCAKSCWWSYAVGVACV